MIDISLLLLLVAATLAGGVLKGIAGFGFGLVVTTVLIQVLPPKQAIAVMILPVLGANVQILASADLGAMRTCVKRFRWYVAASIVGTVLGMQFVALIPDRILSIGIGFFALLFVLFSQRWLEVPLKKDVVCAARRRHWGSQLGAGLLSGGVFGSANNGTLIVSYLESLDIDRETFVGLLSLVVLAATAVRLGQGFRLGLFTGDVPFSLSLFALLPTAAGVMVGSRLRKYVSEDLVRTLVLTLLTIIGVRLLYVAV
ncbi:MAG: sulfite exporter TauE/SafE family protein [Candidatus Nanohaloarchaea archaeon]|nr:sulfite exporter TauE/SafE family protein [Candidatus Nanohaloarchaea archaeon]